LILWIAFSLNLIVLCLRRLPRVKDVELRVYLAAVFAVVIAYTMIGISATTMASATFGPFFWFTAGIGAYWFAGPGRKALRTARAGAG
jgi:hypothetical protein